MSTDTVILERRQAFTVKHPNPHAGYGSQPHPATVITLAAQVRFSVKASWNDDGSSQTCPFKPDRGSSSSSEATGNQNPRKHRVSSKPVTCGAVPGRGATWSPGWAPRPQPACEGSANRRTGTWGCPRPRRRQAPCVPAGASRHMRDERKRGSLYKPWLGTVP